MRKWMRVAVIVVEFNDAEETIRYVREIQTYQNIQRIVVVDNHSTALNTVSLLKEVQNEKVVVLQSDKNGGYNYGNNLGIKYLQEQKEEYDYFIISNPDIKIEEKAIERCLQVLENDEKVAVVAPRMYDANNQPIRRSSWKIRTFWRDVVHSTRVLEVMFYPILRHGEYSQKEYSKELLEVEAISGAFFIIKREVWEQIGELDENVFLFYEEDILAQKLKEKGYKTISVNDVRFIHYESRTIGKTLSYYRKMRELQKSKMYYHEKYNHINKIQRFFLQVLNICRKIELIFEIPIRKIRKK